MLPAKSNADASGKPIVTANVLEVVYVASGRSIVTFKPPMLFENLALSPDNQFLAAEALDRAGVVNVLHLPTKKSKVLKTELRRIPPGGIVFSRDSRSINIVAPDRLLTIALANGETKELKYEIASPAVSYSAATNMLAVASAAPARKPEIQLYDVAQGKQTKRSPHTQRADLRAVLQRWQLAGRRRRGGAPAPPADQRLGRRRIGGRSIQLRSRAVGRLDRWPVRRRPAASAGKSGNKGDQHRRRQHGAVDRHPRCILPAVGHAGCGQRRRTVLHEHKLWQARPNCRLATWHWPSRRLAIWRCCDAVRICCDPGGADRLRPGAP